MPKANLLIINYCILEMKVDIEPAISVPVCSKSFKKWKYVLYKNKTKQKDQKKGGGGEESFQRRESNPRPPKFKVNTLSIAPGQLT